MSSHCAALPFEDVKKIMNEIRALPSRKQEKWHPTMVDTRGVRHRLRFKDNMLQMKTHSDGRVDTSDLWIQVTSLEQARIDCVIARSTQAIYERAMDAKYRAGTGAMFEEIQNVVQEAHTGNHKSNPKPVRIPTKAGEPVRG
jgi:hypothetical protein